MQTRPLYVAVLSFSALLYTTRVFQGSSVLDSLFWFVNIFAFYRSKKKKICGPKGKRCRCLEFSKMRREFSNRKTARWHLKG